MINVYLLLDQSLGVICFLHINKRLIQKISLSVLYNFIIESRIWMKVFMIFLLVYTVVLGLVTNCTT